MRLRFSLAALGLLVAVSNSPAQAVSSGAEGQPQSRLGAAAKPIERDVDLDQQAKARIDSAMSELQATLQAARAEHARVMANARTNSLLWANVNQARLARDSNRVAKTERELADYLTRKLESIDKKPYPEGMTLAKVLEYYKNHRLARPSPHPNPSPIQPGKARIPDR